MTLAVARRGSGPDLVLLHGWGMNAGIWDVVPAPLTEGYTLHCIELPGHGASPLHEGHRDMAGWAEACLAVAPPRAVWLGWSLGGQVALAAALAAPLRVAGLIAVTATPRFLRAPDWPGVAIEDFDDLQTSLRSEPSLTLARFLTLVVRDGEHARVTLRALQRALRDRPAVHPPGLERGLELLRESDQRQGIGRLGCPSLWLHGERDGLVPAAVGAALGRLLPTARCEPIVGAAHAPLLSHPEACAAPIRDFLAALAPAGAGAAP